MDYDVIVCGAGPAGSTAGYELARRGYSVLVLEKQSLPRDKLCAGGLPRKVLRLVNLDDGELIEDRVNRVEFTYRQQDRFVLKSSTPLLYTVSRRRFDQFLVQRARSAGCQIQDDQPLTGLEQRRTGVLVSTSGGRHRARILVGADGVRGPVGRLGGLGRNRRIIATMQSDIPMDATLKKRYRGRVWIGFGWVPRGYAWIFPKRDHLSVGIGAIARRGRARYLKSAFRMLMRYLFPQQQNAPWASFPIALGGLQQNLVRGRTLLVGEAASLVNPLTAEGIFYAIKSAQMAAETIEDLFQQRAPDLEAYQRRVDQEFISYFRKAMVFSGLFYGLPRISFRLFVNNNRHLIRYFGSEVEDPYLH